MAIRLRCRACDRHYSVKDHFAGETIHCKECEAVIHVPDVDDEFDDGWSAQPRRSRKRTRARASLMPWIIGIGGLAAFGLVVAIVQSSNEPIPDAQTPDANGNAQQPNVVGQESKTAARPQAAGRQDADAPFALAAVGVPSFPELGRTIHHFPTGESVFFVDCSRVSQNGFGPGSRMKMRVYLPAGQHQRKSIGCVLVAPAGTNLLFGNDMDASDYHDETLPYVKAGMAVVFYSIDGGIRDRQSVSDPEFLVAYNQFRSAGAGVVNGRNALESVLAKLPQVNPNQIYCAGHSSAGTLSLLLAQHEPRIKACIAYAPATDPEIRLRQKLADPEFVSLLPEMAGFIHRSSPKIHANRFHCPVFLFHARDDSNEPFETTQAFAAKLRGFGKNVTFATAARGNHYRSMINQGIPSAIAWLKQLPTNSLTSDASPTASVSAENPKAASGTGNPPTAILPGRPVVVFDLISYSGKGDQTEAARRALAPVSWARAETVFIDMATNEIVIGIRGQSVGTKIAKVLLERAGFKIGRSRYLGSGRK